MRVVNNIRKKELIRFLFGGGTAVLTDFIIYKLILSAGGDRNLAKGISFVCGSVVGFIINKLWTFESLGFKKGEIVRYIILYSFTAVINTLINRLTLMIVSIEVIGFLCATGVSTVMNFLGQKFFVFKES